MTERTDDDRSDDATGGTDRNGDDATPIDGVLAGDRDGSDGPAGGGSDGQADVGSPFGDLPGDPGSTNGESAAGDGDAAATNGEPGATNGESVPASATADEDDEEVEPVEVLVGLAEDGEIDPWDIDIVSVTDAFLERLDEGDLRTTGRALFYASVLLRMKSDELLAEDDDEAEAPEEPWLADDGAMAAPDYDPVDALEAEMDRRLERKHARGSPETLDELVRELREAERGSWWKDSRTYDTSDSPRGYRRGTQTLDYHPAGDLREEGEPGEEDVTGTTHKEDIESVIDDVRAALREQYDHGRAEVLFVELREAGGTAVMTYLALLFLAHRGAVRLQQDDLFGDLWVQDPAAASVSEEASVVADGGRAGDGDAAGDDVPEGG